MSVLKDGFPYKEAHQICSARYTNDAKSVETGQHPYLQSILVNFKSPGPKILILIISSLNYRKIDSINNL